MNKELEVYKDYTIVLSQPYPNAKIKAVISDSNGKIVKGIKSYSKIIALKVAKHLIDNLKCDENGQRRNINRDGF